MARILSVPNREEWGRLRPELEPGEWRLAEFLADNLDSPWELYLQPYLNGKQADVVLLHPEHGVIVYEVKDWGPDALITRKSTRADGLRLWRRSGKNEWSPRNPVDQARGYADLMTSRLSSLASDDPNTHGDRIRAAVFLSEWKSTNARELLRPFCASQHRADTLLLPIFGRDALIPQSINEVVPFLGEQPRADPVLEETVDRLRHHLQEPTVSSEQREHLPLSNKQVEIATTRTANGYRRVEGAAGSGKSSALAARVAELSAEGRRVLVISQNITLWHYLRDLVSRHRRSPQGEPVANQDRVTYLYFHEWCASACAEAGLASALRGLLADCRDGPYPMAEVLALTARALGEAGSYDATRDAGIETFDAVVVDEGQDLDPDGWQLLRHVVRPGGEMLLAADRTQGLFGMETRWTNEAMSGYGFSGGQWMTLPFSHRLPSSLVPPLADFALRCLGDRDCLLPAPDPQQELISCEVVWSDLGVEELADEVVEAVCALIDEKGVHPADVAFLVEDHELGLQCVGALDARGVATRHVFGRGDSTRRRQKTGFYKGAGCVLGSTIHSFRGWESRCVVLAVSPGWADTEEVPDESTYAHSAAVYVGLTRVKAVDTGAHLIVLNADETLRSFGSQWFSEPESA